MNMECYSCLFFNDLVITKAQFVQAIFNATAAQTANVVILAVTIWIIMQGFQSVMQPESASTRAVNVVKHGIMVMIVMLALRPGAGPPLVNQWILDPLEEMGLQYAMAVLVNSESAPAFPPNAGNAYAQFASVVEAQVFRVIKVPGLLMEAKSGWRSIISGEIILAVIVCIMLILPYAFIFGLVGAFMLEAMFKYVAIGIVANILTPMAVFQPTRPLTIAGMRILVGAFFTMIFTGGALAFTMKTVDFYSYKIHWQSCQTVKGDAAAFAKMECNKLTPPAPRNGMSASDIPDSEKAGELSLLNMNIFMMFIIGFASILLHLQAKALASNISGANDGAGPAAATLAAMKGVASGGAYYAMRAGFGSGGIGASAQQALRGDMFQNASAGGLKGFGQMVQQHGVIGGAAAQAFRFGMPSGNSGGGAAAAQTSKPPAWSDMGGWRSTGGMEGRFKTSDNLSAGFKSPGENQGSGGGVNPRNRQG
jgi:hypothetical protein